MVAGRAARPPGSAPGCQSGRESNRSPLGVSVPASFIGPRRKTQGEEVEATKTLSNTCSRVNRRVFCLSLYVYPICLPSVALAAGFIHVQPAFVLTSVALAAGFIPAATLFSRPPSVASSG